MIIHRLLSLFISSKMQELAEERRAVQSTLKAYEMHGWLWEDDAGARSEPIRSTYLAEVEASDIYLGLFWLGLGPYTIEEFEHACALHKPCLIYEKDVNIEQRSPELVAFLDRLQQVENPEGLTVYRFQTPAQLARQMHIDIMRLLTTHFRRSRQQPSALLWNVPHRRNPFFTGREDLLQHLHNSFTNAKGTAALTQPPAITGLGGIGKTQIAIEYAYRYKQEYQHVFWVTAASRETLIEGFVSIATVLGLPIHDEHDQLKTVRAVQQWLITQSGWLLILDNADDSTLIREFLPAADHGHVLLTTRERAWGALAHSFEVEKMDESEGMLFLLRRAKVLDAANVSLSEASSTDLTMAQAIVMALDGLPLALDQAGAYIEETSSTLAGYLKAYERRQHELLHDRGNEPGSHPDAVATTWSLNFEQVEHLNPAAADLLRCLAFLAPDAIPEEMLVAGAGELGPQLQALASDETLLDPLIKILSRFSLVQRSPDNHLLFIHRLVQAIFRATMTDETQQEWAERTVRAVNQALPDISVDTRAQWERLLPHALACAELIADYRLALPEAAHLLNQTGYYLYIYVQPGQARPLLERALAISEQVLGPTHPDTATSLNNLAGLYHDQGDSEHARPLYERALAIMEKMLGSNHPTTKIVRENYARLLEEIEQKEKE